MASRKKKVNVEAVAAKSIDTLNSELVTLQTMSREALSNMSEAFIQKREELDDVTEVIKEKKSELEELFGKERVLQETDELEEQYQDAKHVNERKTRLLEISHEDRLADLQRTHKDIERQEKQRLQDERRSRAIALEDEERQRQLAFADRESELQSRADEIAKQESDLGSFEDRVKGDVAKQVNAIKRELEFKSKTQEAENKAVVDILEAKVIQLESDKAELAQRLEKAERSAAAAVDKANAIAIATVDAESGKQALTELRTIAQQQAQSGRK